METVVSSCLFVVAGLVALIKMLQVLMAAPRQLSPAEPKLNIVVEAIIASMQSVPDAWRFIVMPIGVHDQLQAAGIVIKLTVENGGDFPVQAMAPTNIKFTVAEGRAIQAAWHQVCADRIADQMLDEAQNQRQLSLKENG